MPQMAPLSWTILMVYFILIFILVNIVNYYLKSFNMKKDEKKYFSSLINWKW